MSNEIAKFARERVSHEGELKAVNRRDKADVIVPKF
jgi:hypothetical protein